MNSILKIAIVLAVGLLLWGCAIEPVVIQEVKEVKEYRHFQSAEELEAWLERDGTDKLDLSIINLAFMLQVRAMGDGYILGVTFCPSGQSGISIINYTVFDDGTVWWINPDTDETDWWMILADDIPLYPGRVE